MTVPPESLRYAAGQLIGEKYRLVRRIDEGGMGTVWEAHNADLDHTVAIKLIRSELAESAAADRLMHEARVLAPLSHPAIVRVFDCGRTAQRIPYIVMELLAGECLADTLDREGRIDATDAVKLLLPVAEALEVVHARGVIHRDLKPENIYLTQADNGRTQPKLLDFGIALSDLGQNLRLTTDGSLLGSPQYMSPEQARGQRSIDVRTDVWAFSVVLYEVISGVSPFQRENYNATLRAIIEEEPKSLSDYGLCDALLASVVERGLEKDRDRRFGSMKELGAALAEWLLVHGVGEDAARASLRSIWIDPASSIPPVSMPESERPRIISREAITVTNASARASSAAVRRPSTGGLSLTTPRRPRSRLQGLLVLGAALAVLGGGAFWWMRRAASLPSGVTSVSAVTPPSLVPPERTEPPRPTATTAEVEPPAPPPARPAAERKTEPKKKSTPRAPAISRAKRELIDPY